MASFVHFFIDSLTFIYSFLFSLNMGKTLSFSHSLVLDSYNSIQHHHHRTVWGRFIFSSPKPLLQSPKAHIRKITHMKMTECMADGVPEYFHHELLLIFDFSTPTSTFQSVNIMWKLDRIKNVKNLIILYCTYIPIIVKYLWTHIGAYFLCLPPSVRSQPDNPLTRQHVMPAVIKCSLCFRNSYTTQAAPALRCLLGFQQRTRRSTTMKSSSLCLVPISHHSVIQWSRIVPSSRLYSVHIYIIIIIILLLLLC